MATILAHYGTHFPRAKDSCPLHFHEQYHCQDSLPPEKLHGVKSEVESHSSSKDLPIPWISVLYAVNRRSLTPILRDVRWMKWIQTKALEGVLEKSIYFWSTLHPRSVKVKQPSGSLEEVRAAEGTPGTSWHTALFYRYSDYTDEWMVQGIWLHAPP